MLPRYNFQEHQSRVRHWAKDQDGAELPIFHFGKLEVLALTRDTSKLSVEFRVQGSRILLK